jgi:Putative transposase
MKTAADALQVLVRDPRYVGARIGALAVLHTWTRAMLFHPHVHLLVTAGGLSGDGASWVHSKNPHFLVPVRALSVIFRAKFCAALKKAGLLQNAPPAVWQTKWVVHSQPCGRGDQVLQYLARYVFRIAIANSRIQSIEDGMVRFRYRDNRTHQIRHIALSGIEFIHRFLQHVLPRGATKVRYYCIFSPSCQFQLERARQLLPPHSGPGQTNSSPQVADPENEISTPRHCPLCHIGLLVLFQTLPAQRSHSP